MQDIQVQQHGLASATVNLQPYDPVLYSANSDVMNASTIIIQTDVNLNGVTNNRLFRVHGNTSDQGEQHASHMSDLSTHIYNLPFDICATQMPEDSFTERHQRLYTF